MGASKAVASKAALHVAICAALASSASLAAEDDEASAKSGASAAPALGTEQQHAVGLSVARALAAKAPERIEALGTVLDPAALVSDESELTVTAAEAHAASAELARLRELYEGGAGASLKMLESAQTLEARARAAARTASARFALHWAPMARESPSARRELVDSVAAGGSVLVRADLPGRHIVGGLPRTAMLDVDGLEVPGRVLGVLREFTELQSAGLLIEVRNAPAGLAAGARLPLALLLAERAGWLMPRGALIYDESGAYVYKQVSAKTAAGATRYVPVRVKLLVPYADGWLVEGIDGDDQIVVHGAGVLWSLEGVGARAVGGAEESDED